MPDQVGSILTLGWWIPDTGSGPALLDPSDIRAGVDRGDGTPGNLTLPLPAKVLWGYQFGAAGIEYTGTLVPSAYVPPSVDGAQVCGPREAVIALLLAQPEIVAQVGDRIFPTWADQGTLYPYIVVWGLTGTHDQHLNGPGGLVEKRIQVDIIATSLAGAELLADQVRLALDGFHGTVLVADESIIVQWIRCESDEEDTDPADDYGDPAHSLQRQSLQFIVYATESVPTR